MKKILSLTVLGMFVAALVVLPGTVSSAEFITEDDNQMFDLSAPVGDDLYAAGSTLLIDQDIADDLFVAGQSIEVTASVGQDVYAAGQIISLSAPVGDDAHAAGNQITVESEIEGDLFAAGQNLVIGADSFVGGSAYVAGESVVIRGEIEGDIRAGVNRLTVAEGAVIRGDLITYGEREPVVESGATVLGERTHNQSEMAGREFGEENLLMKWVRSVLSLFIVAIVLVYVLKSFTASALSTLRAKTGLSFVVGILSLLLALPLAVILLVSVIGIPFTFVVLGMLMIGYVLAAGLAAVFIGQAIMNRLGSSSSSENTLSWVHALLGAVVYEGVQLITGIGGFITLIVVMFTFGSVLITWWSGWRK